MADIIAEKVFKLPVFSWGAKEVSDRDGSRARYLKAVKEADNGNYSPLVVFARS
jgi:hypothetical protein